MCTLITHVRTNQILFCCVCMMLLDANFMLHELAVCHTVRCCSTYITLQNAQGSTYIFSHAFLTLLEKGPSAPVESELRYRFCNRYQETETNVVYLEHRVNHPVPKVSFATGWLATDTNSRQPATPVPSHLSCSWYPLPLHSHPSPLATIIQRTQPQNTESTNTKSIDPKNHSKNRLQN